MRYSNNTGGGIIRCLCKSSLRKHVVIGTRAEYFGVLLLLSLMNASWYLLCSDLREFKHEQLWFSSARGDAAGMVQVSGRCLACFFSIFINLVHIKYPGRN